MIVNVIRLVIIIVLISLCDLLQAQITGEWVFEDYPESEIFDLNVETNEIYLLVQSVYDIDTFKYQYSTSICRVLEQASNEPHLETLYQKNNGSRRFILGKLNRVGNSWFLVESTATTQMQDTFFLHLLNENFAPIKKLSSPVHAELFNYCATVYNQTNYAGIGSIIMSPDSLVGVQNVANYTDSIRINVFRTSPNPTIAFVTSMAFDELRERFLVFHLGGISHLNDTFGLIRRFSGSEVHTAQHGTILAGELSYYTFGATAFQGGPENRDLIFQKFDTAMQVEFSEIFGRTDGDDYPYTNESLHHASENFYIGGMLAGPDAFAFRLPLKFFLAKYDQDMNKLWYREFGGDYSYLIRGLQALDDGRCVVYGYRVDPVLDIRYPYLLIVNEDGLISSTEDIHEPTPDLIQVFSSGNSDLSLEAYEPLDDLVLYAMDGRLVKAFGNVDQGRHSYDLSTVPSALYLLVARSNEGRTQSIKWLKH